MGASLLKQINQAQADKNLASTRHLELLAHNDNVAASVLSATSSLIEYLEGRTSKTELVNQLESISTPDVKYVVEALQVLDQTIKERPLTDLSGVTELMSQLVEEAKLIPKTLPEPQEIPKPVDNTEQLKALHDTMQAIEKVVREQELVAEAPVVNVPETNVHVDAPDLKPLQGSLKDVQKAVEAIVIPEYKTDNKAVEKLIKDSNKLLQKIIDKPVGHGGGGGGWPAVGTNGTPVPLNLDGSGNLNVNIASGGATGGLTDAELRATPVPVDIGSANVTLNASDIEIGAVELKDGATDNRASIINTAPTTEYGIVTRNIPSGTQNVITTSSTSNVTSVAAATTDTTLLASNANRRGAMFFNDSTANLYIKFGTSASTTSFTVKVGAAGYYEMPTNYTGAVNGIWDAVNGSVRLTELS